MNREEAREILSVLLGIPLGPRNEEEYIELKMDFWGMLGTLFDFLGEDQLFKEAMQLHLRKIEEALKDPKFQEFVRRNTE